MIKKHNTYQFHKKEKSLLNLLHQQQVPNQLVMNKEKYKKVSSGLYVI